MKVFILCMIASLVLSSALAQEQTLKSTVFLDSYYATSSNANGSSTRQYVTQSAYDNDLRLNLAMAGLTYDDTQYRAKLSAQYGDSVDINYNAEPQDTFKFFQETYLGVYIDKDTTLDIGTFLSHIGAEGWNSKDNYNYTRSFVAELSPYYQTGARLAHSFNNRWSAQFHVLNGWQNTSEARHPALGTQIKWQNDNKLSVISNTFLGNENKGTRIFHDLIVSKELESGLSFTASIDNGYQQNELDTTLWWWGTALTAKQKISEAAVLNARLEAFQDPSGVLTGTASGDPFRVYAASLGFDYTIGKGVSLRSEVKHTRSPYNIFPDNSSFSDTETVFVISLNFFDERTI